MKSLGKFITIIIILAVFNKVWASPEVSEILRRADEARGNLQGVIWQVTLEFTKRKRIDKMIFSVMARGFDILAESTFPPKSKGNKILMVNGNMWFYKPGLSKPVPISRRQKLLGDAAYGDIASTNYAEDYDAKYMGNESIDGEDCYVLELKSKKKNTTYDKIKYWVSKERLVGKKAIYFTISGKKLKSSMMYYENAIKINGKKRPFISRIVIYEELIDHNVTTLYFTNPRFEKLPDYVFNLNLLKSHARRF